MSPSIPFPLTHSARIPAREYRRNLGSYVKTFWESGDRPSYLVTMLFNDIPGGPAVRLDAMAQESDHFYRVLLKNSERHPRSPARQMYVPILLGHPDLPVPKREKSPLLDVTVNGGLHMNYIAITHMGSRMRVDLDEHVHRNKALYLGASGVKRDVRIDRIDCTPEKAVDYVFKCLGRPEFGFDHVFIRPQTVGEQPLREPLLRPAPEPNFQRRAPMVNPR